MFECYPINEKYRNQVNEMLKREWASLSVVTRGKCYDFSLLDGYVATMNSEIVGIITYRIEQINNKKECEIMSLNSFKEGIGIGTTLMKVVMDKIRSYCHRIWLITTNDNIEAIKFYQKRGFHFKTVYPNAIAQSRSLKPQIPTIGMHNIPIRDEIEFEILFSE